MIRAASWLRGQQGNEVGRSDTHRRVVAGLAFVAIWLTIVAPVISRVLPLWAAAPATSDMACAEHMGHATDPHGPHPQLPSTDRCGYCALVGQSLFLVEAAWLPIVPPQASYLPPHLPDGWHIRRYSSLAPTPRGPPGSVNA
ncbi:Protein of unknown function [Frateuria terrea]|uniref:DUF2946 domain-containing protein n=2 Tax=Frateuria terrea TaxID=529704 RepID=A0A1H6VKS5_9GAMM|nr:Protein of unknown function [Frateuria terrea]SFP65404.1 Protein of unknown function [Frateuria terrea]